MDWHVADDLGFQDIRVMLAYLLVIAAAIAVAGAGAEPRSADRKAQRRLLFAFTAVSYFAWLQILRHLSLHHPVRNAGARS